MGLFLGAQAQGFWKVNRRFVVLSGSVVSGALKRKKPTNIMFIDVLGFDWGSPWGFGK